MTAPSLSPTVASPTSGVSVVTVVFFALFLFFALVSRYLAKLMIAFTKGLPISNVIKTAIKRDLEWPLFLALLVLFLYLSLVVFFPVNQSWLQQALFWIVRL